MGFLANLYVRIALAAGALVLAWAAIHFYNAHEQGIGEARVQAKWDADVARQKTEAINELQAKAKEGLRRTEIQEGNQHAQDAQLAAARADAERNRADADRLREQSASAARDWAARLADSPTASDLAAAGAAIAVCTDVRSRMDGAAGQLAAYADTARAAGNKCAADYDALKAPAP